MLFHQGAPALGEGTLRSEQGLAALRAAAAGCPSPAGQLQVATALDMTDALDARLHVVRHQLLDAARHLAGAKVLAARLYGVGPVTALAMTCWLAGEGRFSSRKAVRFAGLDVTVPSSDRKGPPGRLSRQGPPVLRWALYEACKTHARSSAPDHAYYAQVKERQNGKRAALSEARKILRQACHILAGLGDDALSAACDPRHGDQPVTAPARPGLPQPNSPMGTTAASSRRAAVSRCPPFPRKARRAA